MVDLIKDYRYVDFASKLQKDPPFRNNIVPVTEVPSLINKYRAYGIYATYFLYNENILDYINNQRNEKPSISGYDGKCYAHYLLFDLDHSDLDYAREATVDCIHVLYDEIGIVDKGIKIYYSGNKGFHVMVDTRSFKHVYPSKLLNRYFAEIRNQVADLMGKSGQACDTKISDSVRLLRLPNTINTKNKPGFYKIQLTQEELEKLPVQDIKSIARKPRQMWDTDRTGLLPHYPLSPSNKAASFYSEIMDTINTNFMEKSKFRANKYQQNPYSRSYSMCPAKERIFNSHIEEGERNHCAHIIASYYREIGKGPDYTLSVLIDWTLRNSIGLSEQELSSVIRSAYRPSTPYKYGCSSMKQYCTEGDRQKCRYITEPKSQIGQIEKSPNNGGLR